MSTLVRRLRDFLVPPVDLDPGMDVRRILKVGLTVIGVGVFGIGGWVALAPLAGAVVAPGFVKVDMNRKVVQHQEGGIVSEILVRDGSRVKSGQELLRLDDVRVDAGVDQLSMQMYSERAKEARLLAEAQVAPAPKFPPTILAQAKDPARAGKIKEILDRETALFSARRKALDQQVAELGIQVKQTDAEADALRGQIAAEERALKLQTEELTANEQLLKQGYVQNTRVLGLKRAVAEYESRHEEHRAELAKALQRKSELELRKVSARNAYVQAASDELKDATGRIFDLEERLRPVKDAANRQKIVAPISGEVVGLKVFSPGSVIGPRDVLMEIVPDDKQLIVEAHIRPEDITHVAVGSHADVRLTAYKQRTTPLIAGEVTYVSGDRLQDPGPVQVSGGPYYMVHIAVKPESLASAGDLRMTAGMPAEIYIRTDNRTTLDYLLAPMTNYFRRGMREPL